MKNEKYLIEQILRGNKAAFGLLVDKYQPLVAHIVFRMVTNSSEREDICQDIFLKVYQNLKKFRFESKLSTWIARIAYNTAINYLEKKKTEFLEDLSPNQFYLENYIDGQEQPLYIVETQNQKNLLHNEILKLPIKYRMVISLYHLDEMSYAEIGQILDMPVGTVKNYLFRARQILKNKIIKRYQAEEI